MATALEESEKEVRIVHIHANTYHLVKKKYKKIGRVDPEIIVLKETRIIIDADCTNSYVLNSGVTEPNLTKFL